MIIQKINLKLNMIIACIVCCISYLLIHFIVEELSVRMSLTLLVFVIAYLFGVLLDVVRAFNGLLDKYNSLTEEFERFLNDYHETQKIVGSTKYNLELLIKQKKDSQRVHHHSKEEMDEMLASAPQPESEAEQPMEAEPTHNEMEQVVDYEMVPDEPEQAVEVPEVAPQPLPEHYEPEPVIEKPKPTRRRRPRKPKKDSE